MEIKTFGILAAASLALSACAGTFTTEYETTLDPSVTRGWTVSDVRVSVPTSLSVSDANRFAPNADIVWHGDPPGDRRAQVQRIMDDAITSGASGLRGGKPVIIGITVQTFHSLSPLALSEAPSGVHNITYSTRVFDARTGDPLTETEVITADLEAFTGAAAVVAVQQGETQKVRINRHLEDVTRGWLGIGPDPRRQFSGLGR